MQARMRCQPAAVTADTRTLMMVMWKRTGTWRQADTVHLHVNIISFCLVTNFFPSMCQACVKQLLLTVSLPSQILIYYLPPKIDTGKEIMNKNIVGYLLLFPVKFCLPSKGTTPTAWSKTHQLRESCELFFSISHPLLCLCFWTSLTNSVQPSSTGSFSIV